jgi:hypothetical protein
VGRRLFHVHTRHGFFNLSTWLTAIADAAVLLLVFQLSDRQVIVSGDGLCSVCWFPPSWRRGSL